MKYSGLPKRFIRAFKKLYANNVHFLRFMGKVYRAYVNASGVKQVEMRVALYLCFALTHFYRWCGRDVGLEISAGGAPTTSVM